MLVFEQRRWTKTLLTTPLQFSTEFPLQTVIHTCAHLALATHLKASWVNDPQVALKTLKLRAHMCP